MRLFKKKAIATGASRGIGKAIALAFAKEGADVVLHYLADATNMRSTLKEVGAMGRKAQAIPIDSGHSLSF